MTQVVAVTSLRVIPPAAAPPSRTGNRVRQCRIHKYSIIEGFVPSFMKERTNEERLLDVGVQPVMDDARDIVRERPLEKGRERAEIGVEPGTDGDLFGFCAGRVRRDFDDEVAEELSSLPVLAFGSKRSPRMQDAAILRVRGGRSSADYSSGKRALKCTAEACKRRFLSHSADARDELCARLSGSVRYRSQGSPGSFPIPRIREECNGLGSDRRPGEVVHRNTGKSSRHWSASARGTDRAVHPEPPRVPNLALEMSMTAPVFGMTVSAR